MKKSLIIVLAFAQIISGCSTASLFYRNADWYLRYKIDSYTSFNDRQKDTIRREISAYVKWHRKYALPEYIIFLQNLNGAAQYDGQLSAGKITMLRTQLLDLYKKTMAPLIKPAAEILGSLDSGQIRELADKLAEENQKYRKERLGISRDEYLDKRADKTVDFLEWLAGDLNSDQQQKIREMSRNLPEVGDIYLRQREANQDNLITLLNNHAGKEQIAAFLSSWIFTPEASRSALQQQEINTFELASDEMIARIQGMLTVRQKAHILKLISAYIDDMHAESRKAGQEPDK